MKCSDCYKRIETECASKGVGCAPELYVAWVGTDKHGQNMLSAGARPARPASTRPPRPAPPAYFCWPHRARRDPPSSPTRLSANLDIQHPRDI